MVHFWWRWRIVVYRATIYIFLDATPGSLSAENCVAPFGSSEDESNSISRQSQNGSKAARMTHAVRARCRTEAWKPYSRLSSDEGLVPRGGPSMSAAEKVRAAGLWSQQFLRSSTRIMGSGAKG